MNNKLPIDRLHIVGLYCLRLSQFIRSPKLRPILCDVTSIGKFKRFGKSVFLQMVLRFLEGKKDFFKGTKIAERGNSLEEYEGWEPFPVIYLDFEDIPVDGTMTEFCKRIARELQEIAQSHKLPVWPNIDVGELIHHLKKTTGKHVSILIDNYDYPLMNDQLSPKLRQQVTIHLAQFYRQIRARVGQIRLGLAVGQSTLNIIGNGNARFTDLSFGARFLSAMGFNLEEFESTLKPYTEQLIHPNDRKFAEKYERIRNNLRTWYGKHRFSHLDSRTQLLNPASTCACLKTHDFGDHMGGNSLFIPEIQSMFEKLGKTVEDFEQYAIKRAQPEISCQCYHSSCYHH